MKKSSQKSRPGTSIRYESRAASRTVRRAAALEGVGPSVFVRDAAQARAHRVIAEHAAREGRCPECGRPLEDHESAA
jgi:uncharacterized protein (DUF1778 family)